MTDMSENQTTPGGEKLQSPSKTTSRIPSKYKMGEWEDMEEDMLLEAMRQLREEREAQK